MIGVVMTTLLCLTSCGGGDDIVLDEQQPKPQEKQDDKKTEDEVGRDSAAIINSAQATILLSHTDGAGFNIVLMADGYTQADINNGTYSAAIQKAFNGLFSMEPMASLKQYCDVYQVVVPSVHQGIDYSKHNTALGARFESKESSGIYGDSIMAQNITAKALGMYTKKGITQQYVQETFNKTLTIVLLNSKLYGGVTLLALDENAKDKIPAGFSLAYIPANPVASSYKGSDLFERLLQHEAVGHGIGKLADEYFYSDEAKSEDVSKLKYGQAIGAYMNVHYDTNIAATRQSEYYGTYDKKISLYKYRIDKDDWDFHAFITDVEDRYKAENLAWYQGGFTFPYDFYRPTKFSLMNSSVDPDCDHFNAPSRLMIYKRIMRAAKGAIFTCNLNESADFEAFALFDSKTWQGYPSPAKGMKAADEFVNVYNHKQLHAPVVMKNWQFSLQH